MVDGVIPLPSKPVGVELSREALERYAADVSFIRSPLGDSDVTRVTNATRH